MEPGGATERLFSLHRRSNPIKTSALSGQQAPDEGWRVGAKRIDTPTLTVIIPQLFYLTVRLRYIAQR